MDKNLKQLRIEKGYTLRVLSGLSGVSTSYLSSLENGEQTNPSLEIVEKIAIALHEDIVYICYTILQNAPKRLALKG